LRGHRVGGRKCTLLAEVVDREPQLLLREHLRVVELLRLVKVGELRLRLRLRLLLERHVVLLLGLLTGHNVALLVV
jgi:hypothetical protein